MIGCQGGVGRAVVALLARSAPGRRLNRQVESLALLDRVSGDSAVLLPNASVLPAMAVESAQDLTRLILEHRLTEILDLSSLDTLDCVRACEEHGVNFLCTSVEEWEGAGFAPTDDAIGRLLPPERPVVQGSHLVGSGANPGIVNALMFAALAEFAQRVRVAPTPEALDLHAALITEEDTTVERCAVSMDDTFPMTWSPRHCLEELFERRAFVASSGRVESLGHRPVEREYRARCGQTEIDGFAVPHEEVITLAQRFPTLEIGFVYRINPAARWALRMHPQRKLSQWRTHRLYPPVTETLAGEDRLGILLCSRRYGELWMGFRTDVSEALAFGTNATQLQVAAGVLAGWSLLGTCAGIHFVEDLDWRAFLRVVYQVLGAPMVVHDKLAPARLMRDRMVVAGSGSQRRKRVKPDISESDVESESIQV